MEIKIPFTDRKFTGELRWNLPETEEQKEQIAFNNSVLTVVLLVLAFSHISIVLSSLGALYVFVQCCRRDLMLYSIGVKSDLISVCLQVALICFLLKLIVSIFSDFQISGFELIECSYIAFYIYTWRAEIKEFYTYVKSSLGLRFK